MSKTILVCGGRDYADEEYLFRVLQYINDEVGIQRLVASNERGAAALTVKWAKYNDVAIHTFDTDQRRYGKEAESIRNQKMVDEEGISFVLAFPGGRGTEDMLHKANVANISQIYLKGRKDRQMVYNMLKSEEKA